MEAPRIICMINHSSRTPTDLSLHEWQLCLQNGRENLYPLWGLFKASRSTSMSRENREGKVLNVRQLTIFLNCFFLSHSLKRSNQHLSRHGSNIFFNIHSSKMIYSYLRTKFINWSSISNQKCRGQSQQACDKTYKLGHTSKWNTNPAEPQRSLGRHWMESKFC